MPATQVSCEAWLGDKRWKGRGLKPCAAGAGGWTGFWAAWLECNCPMHLHFAGASELGKRPRRCPRIGTDCWARAVR